MRGGYERGRRSGTRTRGVAGCGIRLGCEWGVNMCRSVSKNGRVQLRLPVVRDKEKKSRRG